MALKASMNKLVYNFYWQKKWEEVKIPLPKHTVFLYDVNCEKNT